MNLQNLESFLAIYEQGSLSKAAEQLYLTQPTLSSRLAALEEELGVSIIERKKGVRGMEITPDGMRLLGHVRELVALRERTENSLRIEHREVLKIGMALSIGTFLLPTVIKNFAAQNPDIQLQLRHPLHTECSQALCSGQIQFALNTMLKEDKRIEPTPILNEKLIFVCSHGSRYKNGMRVDDLPVEREIYVGQWNKSGYSARFVNWHKKHFGTVYPLLETTVVPFLEHYFTVPDIWGIFPASIAMPYIKSGVVETREVRGVPKERTVYMLMRKGEIVDAPMQKFLDVMRDTLRDSEEYTIL